MAKRKSKTKAKQRSRSSANRQTNAATKKAKAKSVSKQPTKKAASRNEKSAGNQEPQELPPKYCYRYPHPAVSVDCVVFGLTDGKLNVLLIERGGEPFKGKWALPGGFVEINEGLDTAAQRELEEETGMTDLFLEQLYTFGAVKRDPRERVISVAYYALVNRDDHDVAGASDAAQAVWFAIDNLPSLAFDHESIFLTAIERLKAKVRYEPIGFELLPEKFTLSQLQALYESILEQPIDKRNFRKKIVRMGILIELDEYQTGVAYRAPRLYSFDEQGYREKAKAGFNFEV